MTMTLGRKIALRNAVIFGGLLLLGAASLAGIIWLWGSVQTALVEYEELRLIHATELASLRAEALLNLPNTTEKDLLRELQPALAALDEFQSMQDDAIEGSPRHEAKERATLDRSRASLKRLVAEAQAGPLTPERRQAHVDELRELQDGMRTLASDADVLIGSTQRRAYRYLKRGTAAVGGLFFVTAAFAAVMSILQYRGVMRPLGELRRAVRQIASGDLSQRVRVHAEREFVELGDDFNRMARELDELYKTLEQKVQDRSRELVQSERLASVGFLAAGVAHEINNPLGIMSGYAELSLKRLRGGDPAAIDDARRSLQIIRDEAQRCREITEKLLSLASPGSKARTAEVSVSGVIQDVVQMISGHASYHDRRISTVIEEGAPLVVNGSETELKQVLLNLVINALDATRPGGQVRVEARRDRDMVLIVVSDNGRGMSAEIRDRVFEPFFSARSGKLDGENRGTGLGLSITRVIVESYGGRISAGSDGEGLGSRFSVFLPAVAGRFSSEAPAAPGDLS